MRRIAIWTLLALSASATVAVAQQPSQAQISAIKQACRGDYQSYCASVPTGGSAALQCLQGNAPSLSAPCQQALGAMNGGGAPQGTPSSTANAASPMSAPPQGSPYQPAPAPMSRRQQAMLLRADCGRDFRRLCYGVQPGGGRAIACLYAHGPQLSPVCRAALTSR